jgi:hypothetical protein
VDGARVSWSGKALGGLFGALVGGPVGAGVGAAVGHYLGDVARPPQPLELTQLRWVHHAFSASGPGVKLTPVWRSRGLHDVDVTVRVDAGTLCQTTVIVPEHAAEDVEEPEWLVPYAAFPQGEVAEISVTLRAAALRGGREPLDKDRFQIPMPRGVRRLGNSGPGRVVMALVACARAGGRDLTTDDLDYIRVRFVEGYPLDARGLEWLAAWTKELATAEVSRLAPDAVANRLATHVDAAAAERVLTWLMHGTRASWPGEAAERFIAGLALELGLEARLDSLWRQVAAEPDPVALARAAGVLGVAAGTAIDEAKRAYRALMLRWHPDRARTPEEARAYTERTVRINAAWQVFSGGR